MNPWVLFTVSPHNQLGESLLLSLLFFFLSHREKSYVPFRGQVSKISESGQLCLLCLQIFLILLDTNFQFKTLKQQFNYSIELHQIMSNFQEGSNNELDTPMGNSLNNEKYEQELKYAFQNQFRDFVRGNFDLDIWHPIISNILDICYIPIEQTFTLLPTFTKQIPYQEEILLFLFHLCDKNEKFVELVASEGFEKITYAILYNLAENQAHPRAQISTYLVSILILTTLSKTASYNQCLTKEIEESVQLPGIPIVHGSYGDLLVVTISSIVLNAFTNYQ